MVKHISFSIRDRSEERLLAMNINPGKLSKYLLESWLNEHEDDYGKLFIIMELEKRMHELELEVMHLEHKKKLLEHIKKELEVEKESYHDTNRYVEYHHLTKYLNRRILKYKYNREEIEKKHSDVITSIKEIRPDFDLDAQIAMVKKLRDECII